LGMFFLRDTFYLAGMVEDHGSRAGCPLIDRKDIF
jgi:hypothetical protein